MTKSTPHHQTVIPDHIIELGKSRGPERAAMLRYPKRLPPKRTDSSAAHTEPCGRCGDPVTFTRSEWATVQQVNAMLVRRGEPVLGPEERALCGDCRQEHRAEQDATLVRQADADRLQWRRYVDGQIDARELLRQCYDRRYYERRVREHRNAMATMSPRERRRLQAAGLT